MTTGVYIIKNTINNKVYIGSAINCEKRFIEHKSALKKQQHNRRLQNFVNKYGNEILLFDIIEIISDKKNLFEREQYWINFYQSYKSKNGYNIAKIAGSTLGIKMPKSHKEASRKRMLGNKYRLGKKWTDIEKKEISKRSKAFWEKNPEILKKAGEKSSNLRRGIPQWTDKNHPMLGKKHPSIRTIIIYKDGKEIDRVQGVEQTAKKYNLHPSGIVRVCNKKLKQTGGFFMEYASSKTCSCGAINQELTLSDREWICEECGVKHDRDILAANNIKRFSLIPQGLRKSTLVESRR